MATAPARLYDNGRVTVPIELRRELGLEDGDYVILDIKPFAPEATEASGGR